MLNPVTHNIQVSLKHAWGTEVLVFEVLGSEIVKVYNRMSKVFARQTL